MAASIVYGLIEPPPCALHTTPRHHSPWGKCRCAATLPPTALFGWVFAGFLAWFPFWADVATGTAMICWIFFTAYFIFSLFFFFAIFPWKVLSLLPHTVDHLVAPQPLGSIAVSPPVFEHIKWWDFAIFARVLLALNKEWKLFSMGYYLSKSVLYRNSRQPFFPVHLNRLLENILLVRKSLAVSRFAETTKTSNEQISVCFFVF